MKKYSYGLISSLNESFNKDIKERKTQALKESQNLKETQWKLTLDNSLRKAISEEDYDKIIEALRHYNEVVQNSNAVDEFTKEEFQKFIDDYEMDFDDIEALEVDDPEESLNYILDDFYDLCDNTEVFIELGESENLDESKKLNETGEWDDNDEEMQAWLEDLRLQADELANQIDGEVKIVKGFDAYQGPFAIVHSPRYGDMALWYNQEDDTGRSFNLKIAHVGWISGGINDLANLLNQDKISDDALIEDEDLCNKQILNEDSYEFDKLVQGEDLYFRDSEGTPLLGHYASNYPKVEEYDEGLLPENGATKEEYQDAKNAEQSGDVWEFLVVDENTLEPTSEVYTYIYGNNALYEFVTKQLRPVKVKRSLEESDSTEIITVTNGNETTTFNFNDLDFGSGIGDYYYNGNETGAQIGFVWNEEKGQHYIDGLTFTVYVGNNRENDLYTSNHTLANQTPDEEFKVTLTPEDYKTFLFWVDSCNKDKFTYWNEEDLENINESDSTDKIVKVVMNDTAVNLNRPIYDELKSKYNISIEANQTDELGNYDVIFTGTKENIKNAINDYLGINGPVDDEEFEESIIEESSDLEDSRENSELEELVKKELSNGKIPDEIQYKDKTYKAFNVMDSDNDGKYSQIYFCNMENTPSGDPQESNDYFFVQVELNPTDKGYEGVKEIKFVEDLTESQTDGIKKKITKLVDKAKKINEAELNSKGTINREIEELFNKLDKAKEDGAEKSRYISIYRSLDDNEYSEKDLKEMNTEELYDVCSKAIHDYARFLRNSIKESKEVTFKDKVKAIKKTLLKDKRKTNKSAQKSAENIAGSMVNEEDIVLVNTTTAEPDYVITDVTELEDTNLGDVQSPDIDAMLTMIQESIKDVYGPDSINIHIHSSNLLENGSFALVDIQTPEILKEFEKINSKDTAVGKSLILENKSHGLYEFRVNNTSGTTRYIKRTKEPAKAIYEWLETEFLSEAKKAKEEEKKVHNRAKLEDTINQFLSTNPDLQLAIETLKMYIEAVGKEGKEAIKPMIEKIAVEFPVGVTTTDDSLTFDSREDIIELLFGKEWIPSEPEEVEPSVPGGEVIKESENLNESYQQFNIGEIDVVYNPETQEVMYSVGADDKHDKKINLTKIPSVDIPYNTETIIKHHIELQYGPIPEEIENDIEEPEGEELPLPQEEPTQENMEDEVPMTEEDNEISQDVGLDQSTPEEDEALEDSKPDTGSAKFQKIKPNSGVSVEDIRTSELDGTVQADSQYIVVEEINLDDTEFAEFSNDVSKPQDFFTGVTPLDRRNYPFNVVKITNESSPYDIVADPVGYNYGRYVAVIDKGI